MALSPDVSAEVPAAPPTTTNNHGTQQQLVPMMKASALPMIVLLFIALVAWLHHSLLVMSSLQDFSIYVRLNLWFRYGPNINHTLTSRSRSVLLLFTKYFLLNTYYLVLKAQPPSQAYISHPFR